MANNHDNKYDLLNKSLKILVLAEKLFFNVFNVTYNLFLSQ